MKVERSKLLSSSSSFSSSRTLPSPRFVSSIDMPERQRDEGEMVGERRRRLRLRMGSFPLSEWEIVAAIGIFSLFIIALLSIYMTMPILDEHALKLPQTLAELQEVKDHLSAYTKDYTVQVLLGYIATYIFMQTFMIPGTIFLSLLAGALFGVYKGLFLVVFSATMGASSSFFLSKLFGRPIAFWLWPDKMRFFQAEVTKRREKLLNYMLFLRVTPTLPNTFVNVASPIVDVPFHIFFMATFFGIIPASIVTVRAGLTLGELQSVRDLYDTKTIVLLFTIGLLFVIPTLFRRPRQSNSNLKGSN